MTARGIAMALLICTSLTLQLGMGRRAGEYDVEAKREMKQNKEHLKGDAHYGNDNPAKGVVEGVKQATVDSTTGLISDTASETVSDVPVRGTLQGARIGSEKVVDNAVKGVFKVATLGYGEVDSYKKEEPEHGSGEPTKFSIAL